MSGKHTKKNSKSYVGVIIVLIIVVVIAGVIVFFYISGNENHNNLPETSASSASEQSKNTTVSPTVTSEIASTESTHGTVENTSEASEPSSQPVTENEQSEQSQTEKVVVPDSDDDDDDLYFDAVYTPYKAVDTDTENTVSMREVFGSSYTGGTFVFNSDGTFTDNLSISSVNSGAYTVSGNTIRATYTNDKNITVNIVSGDGNIPEEIVINYGGYDVYFN